MERLSDDMALDYRSATLPEILSWSFGELRAVRDPLARAWSQIKGTLDDEGIFGPRRDYQCACGKFEGTKFEQMICDRCGVRIASHEIRRTRFAHLELAYPIPHPLIEPISTLDRRFSQRLNLPNLHPIFSADRPVFPGFFGI